MSIVAWLEGLTRRRLDLDEEDFQDEIRAHLAIAEDERMADGADRQTAHYAVLKEFGNVTLTTEAARRVWTPSWLETVRDYASDARYAIRALAKNPAFALTVVGVLTLGIGLNAAVFTMVKSLALTPIAGVDGSAGLAVIFAETSTGRQVRVSYPDYQYLRDHDGAFSDLFSSIVVTANLGRGRSARQVWGELVTPVLVGYAERLAAPERIFFNIGVDGLVIGFAALVACGSALVFGFVPALHSSRVDLVSVINEDASPRGASRGTLRAGLVVAQVAVSLLLLVGAGLVMRSLDAARRANPGFDAAHVTMLAVDVKQNAYDESRGRVFYRALLDAARAAPGIESATLAAFTPMGFLDTPARRIAIEGYEPRRGEDLAFMSNTIGSDYFRTLRIARIAGRAFEDQDDETAAPVAVVNTTFADRFWGGAANAIGKRLRVGDGDWRTVIGVAADVKYSRINESPRPYLYLPFLQSYRSSMILHTRGPSTSLGAGPAPVERLVDLARAHVAALDADLPILYARPLAEGISGALILFNLTAKMLFLFGVAGMALAAMGTYGLVSYTVEQSTREIGIRMALGAPRLSVVRGFLARGLRLGAIGAALGVVAALAVTRLLGSVLFGVSATDGTAFARALAVVLGGVMVATIVPAWRAARTDPLSALRHH